jgi:hypothetical protein
MARLPLATSIGGQYREQLTTAAAKAGWPLRIELSCSSFPANEIVSSIWAATNYSYGEWGAYECQECGSAHLGRESAYRCCAEQMIECEAAEAV